jgi:hypothetical protein
MQRSKEDHGYNADHEKVRRREKGHELLLMRNSGISLSAEAAGSAASVL